jgi:hypothetical protein
MRKEKTQLGKAFLCCQYGSDFLCTSEDPNHFYTIRRSLESLVHIQKVIAKNLFSHVVPLGCKNNDSNKLGGSNRWITVLAVLAAWREARSKLRGLRRRVSDACRRDAISGLDFVMRNDDPPRRTRFGGSIGHHHVHVLA